jgi:hypothetical protein
MTDRDAIIKKHFDVLLASLTEKRPELFSYYDLEKAIPEEVPSPAILDGLVQKALVLLIKQKLDTDPGINQRFVTATKIPLWNQLLTAARIKELARARIVKKGGQPATTAPIPRRPSASTRDRRRPERQKVLTRTSWRSRRRYARRLLTLETVERRPPIKFFDEVIAEQVTGRQGGVAAAGARPRKKKTPRSTGFLRCLPGENRPGDADHPRGAISRGVRRDARRL